MFNPKYHISPKLLKNIKQITLLVDGLNHKKYSEVVLIDYENKARALSTFASTSIEGNPLPLTEVKKILKNRPQNLRDTEKEVLNYNQALIDVNQYIKKDLKLDEKFILNLHKMIMKDLLPKFSCGKWRKGPVFINDPRTQKTIFLPPDHADVDKFIKQLLKFIEKNQSELDPILLSGIFHKQLVLIHPFVDGNGRTTRLATKLLLSKLGIDTFHLFSFENYYNQNVTKYFQHVGEHGDYYDLEKNIDFTKWLEYFSDGIIDELLRVQKDITILDITPDNILEKHHHIILNYIREHGHITDKIYSKLTERAKATRALDFKKLSGLGYIIRLGKGPATIYKLA